MTACFGRRAAFINFLGPSGTREMRSAGERARIATAVRRSVTGDLAPRA